MAVFRAEFLFCPLVEPDMSAYVSNPRVSLVLAKNDGKSSPAVLRMLAPAAYQPTSKPIRRAWDNVLLNAFEPAVCVTKLKSPW